MKQGGGKTPSASLWKLRCSESVPSRGLYIYIYIARGTLKSTGAGSLPFCRSAMTTGRSPYLGTFSTRKLILTLAMNKENRRAFPWLSKPAPVTWGRQSMVRHSESLSRALRWWPGSCKAVLGVHRACRGRPLGCFCTQTPAFSQ